jgi:hypothetical protein
MYEGVLANMKHMHMFDASIMSHHVGGSDGRMDLTTNTFACDLSFCRNGFQLLKAARNLRSLTVDLAGLTGLEIPFMFYDQLVNFVNANTQLTHLYLASVTLSTKYFIRLKPLHHLYICYNRKLTQQTLKELCERQPELRHLVLQYCNIKLTDDLKSLNGLKQLCMLNLSDNPGFKTVVGKTNGPNLHQWTQFCHWLIAQNSKLDIYFNWKINNSTRPYRISQPQT